MRVLVQLCDSKKRPMRSLDVGGESTLQAFTLAALGAALPGLEPRHLKNHAGAFQVYCKGRLLTSGNSSRGSISSLGIQESDTVQLVPSLRGGGGDGGSTCAESRSCYLEMYAKKKPSKVDRQDTLFAKWTTCRLSSEALSPPCVVDKLGNILNKEAVIKALQNKSFPPGMKHIRGLRDIRDVKLSEIPSISEDALVRFQCPISGAELNGNSHFVAMRCCGHVVSQRALKELKAQTSCPMCFATVGESDKLPVNGTDEEVEELRKRMDEERAKAKADKKKGQVVTGASALEVPSVPSESASQDASSLDMHPTKASEKPGSKVGTLPKAAPAQSTGASMDDKLVSKKDSKRKTEDLQNQAKRYKATNHVPAGASKEVYASIFTSSRKEEFKETYSCRSLPLGRN